jgi:2-polyprenyl-3-methyl-5-hydroxy-6-metoxy-1,4-benzoquinol methylase
MDDPALEAARHEAALEGLVRINTLSATARTLWPPILDLARQLRLSRLRVLDVATGAGDIPLTLWRNSQRSDLALEIHGVDVSERALEFARRRAEESRADIEFSRLDVVADNLPPGFDVIVSSLFLHHLTDKQARALLAKMGRAAEHMVLVSDLRRSRPGLVMAYLAGRLLTRSDVVRVDAARSVRAAFSLQEVRGLARAAGLDGATVQRKWPCRFLLAWRRPHLRNDE